MSSDFELYIRESLLKYFSGIKVKGCIFQKKGFKGDFSNLKANGPFCGFIRAILGLPYVPPEQMNEGNRNTNNIIQV